MDSKWILTPNKLLTRLPILLTQVKDWKQFKQIKKLNQANNIFCTSILKSLIKFATI